MHESPTAEPWAFSARRYNPGVESQNQTDQLSTSRALSIDALRGLVMFTMVFVNDIAGARGLPAWMKHFHNSPKHPSGMTFVDVVFPAFLFIVGMSIPLAIESRRRRGQTWPRLLSHVALRTLFLLAVGVLMVNVDDERIGWPANLWAILMLGGVIFAFHSVALASVLAKRVSLSVRIVGALLLIYLAIRFRNAAGEHLQPQWWGILGLIGWAYLVVTIAYLLLRNDGPWALAAATGLLMCLYIADHAGAFDAWQRWHFFMFGHKYAPLRLVNIGEMFGSQASVTMAGAVIGAMLLPNSPTRSPTARIRFAAVFAILLAIGGLLLVQSFGVSKNDATPSWCLWSAAITTILWIVLYAIIDVLGWRAGSIPLAWAGASALLIYIVSELWSVVSEQIGWQWYDNLGARYPSVVYHGLLTAGAICLLCGVLGRIGFRLRL
jgi:predicted acyltransferase